MDKDEVDKLVGYLEGGGVISPAETLRVIAYYRGVLARIKQVTNEMAPDPRQELLPFARVGP